MNTDPKYLAQGILSRRDNSEWELRQKLAKKGIDSKNIEETIVWLKGKKYLNDEEFAKTYIESILRTKAVGRRYLAHKLKEKHINPETIDAALQELVGEEVEKELAQKAAKAWQKAHPKFAQDKMRLSRFLASRGFTSFPGLTDSEE
ncbi:MAG: regulatory protein RecX [Candidatus Andersenbacteria bacterium]|nr:regulatory protein RecX [Candidatus Andersenbacteria bacterium]